MSTPYIGRFAPSPTGPLHFGSLLAAVASFLDARSVGGRWLLRIEDLDPPREVPGAADAILRVLDAYALHWDGAVVYQSQRSVLYADALAQLRSTDWLFPCACSRREIADNAVAGPDGPIYPGTCRAGLLPGREARAWRVRVADRALSFDDRAQGRQTQNLATEVGDFVVKRADGITAYQLAVVVDDAEQGVTHVVRGSDLLLSTPRQIHLQQCLDLPTPAYLHCPVVINAAGEKLSKQTFAPAIDPHADVALACRILEFLAQPLPAHAHEMNLPELWRAAAQQWNPGLFSGQLTRSSSCVVDVGGHP